MIKYVVTIIILLFAAGCKNKKKIVPEQPQTSEISALYNKLVLPFTVTDSSLKEVADTNTISYSVFSQFVPDSIFNEPFGKNRKLTIHPVGKIEQKGKESYYITLVNNKSDSAVYLSVYNKDKFVVSIPLIANNDGNSANSASIDKKLSVVLNKEWTVKNEPFYKRTIYAYNNAGVFTTVLTETNEDRSAGKTNLNPWDTFPKRNKYSGDYVKGNKNVLFIRDSKTAGQYLFYVHFETDDKEDPCAGELKGSFKMVSEKTGTYTSNGDPCVLNFTFTGSKAAVKETGSCGNYRGIKCFFNDTYVKRNLQKSAQKKRS